MRRIVVTSCSNPSLPLHAEQLPALREAAAQAGYLLDTEPLLALSRSSTNTSWRWSPRERARIVMEAYTDDDVPAILDISGGDLAGEVLPYLDLGVIRDHPTLMVGYSDISCVLGILPTASLLWNPILATTRGFGPISAALDGQILRPSFTPAEGITGRSAAADQLRAQISALPWVGGNLRCFLKLAGTPWWPRIAGSVLVIESLNASLRSLAAGLAQHRTLGTFATSTADGDRNEGCAAIVVGQLTRIDHDGERAQALELIREYGGPIPIFQSEEFGHSDDSAAVTLGPIPPTPQA